MINLIQLSRKISRCNFKDLKSVIPFVKEYNGDDWKEFVRENNKTYNRAKIPIEFDNFDIYILTWKPGQTSPIHDHADYGCVLKMLKGTLTERLYTSDLAYKREKKLSSGEVSFMNNEMGVHQVYNEENEIAISLHIYSPADYKSKIYIII